MCTKKNTSQVSGDTETDKYAWYNYLNTKDTRTLKTMLEETNSYPYIRDGTSPQALSIREYRQKISIVLKDRGF